MQLITSYPTNRFDGNYLRLIELCERVIIVKSPELFESPAIELFRMLNQRMSREERQNKIIFCEFQQYRDLPELDEYITLKWWNDDPDVLWGRLENLLRTRISLPQMPSNPRVWQWHLDPQWNQPRRHRRQRWPDMTDLDDFSDPMGDAERASYSPAPVMMPPIPYRTTGFHRPPPGFPPRVGALGRANPSPAQPRMPTIPRNLQWYPRNRRSDH